MLSLVLAKILCATNRFAVYVFGPLRVTFLFYGYVDEDPFKNLRPWLYFFPPEQLIIHPFSEVFLPVVFLCVEDLVPNQLVTKSSKMMSPFSPQLSGGGASMEAQTLSFFRKLGTERERSFPSSD